MQLNNRLIELNNRIIKQILHTQCLELLLFQFV